MISDSEAFVWIWLPGEVKPVVAGRVFRGGGQYLFNYGQSYLALQGAIALHEEELPLRAGIIHPLPGLNIAGCLRDGSPDAWGRRVLLNRLSNDPAYTGELNESDQLLFMLHSGSNRTGSLDFQSSATQYTPRVNESGTLEELLTSAERVENGTPLTHSLDAALMHGTSIGGARPKAQLVGLDKQYIAKFSSQSDTRSIVKAEYVAMRLAHEVGLTVAPVEYKRVLNKDVLMVERFDREFSDSGWHRKAVVSALTLLKLDEMMGRYASYEELAEFIRLKFKHPKQTLLELFGRLVFNILVGNTDDHARNHAAFWDGKQLSLTPAYDICPQSRSGGEASQAMMIVGQKNLSRLDLCLESAVQYGIKKEAALQVIGHQIQVIKNQWDFVCDEVDMSVADRNLLWGRQIFNPFSTEGFENLVSG